MERTVQVTVNFYFKRLTNGNYAPRAYSEELKNLPVFFSSNELNWSVITKNGRSVFVISHNATRYEVAFMTKLQFSVSEDTLDMLKKASEEEVMRIQQRMASKKDSQPKVDDDYSDGFPF